MMRLRYFLFDANERIWLFSPRSRRTYHGDLSAIPGFALECELGRGAFAVVYLAVNRTLESHITLKPLRMLMLGQGEDGARVR